MQPGESICSACATADIRGMGVVACFDSGLVHGVGGCTAYALEVACLLFVARIGRGWADYVACRILQAARMTMNGQGTCDIRLSYAVKLLFGGQTLLII